MNYVNENEFLSWYEKNAKDKQYSKPVLLNEVFENYCETRVSEYVLSADKTVSGKEERYPFKYDEIGCCGADTKFIYF